MLTLAQIEEGMNKLNGWFIDGQSITKEWEFKHFSEAIAFLNKVNEAAVKVNHYPAILLDQTIVRLVLTTRTEKGLSDKDFNLAEELDKIV